MALKACLTSLISDLDELSQQQLPIRNIAPASRSCYDHSKESEFLASRGISHNPSIESNPSQSKCHNCNFSPERTHTQMSGANSPHYLSHLLLLSHSHSSRSDLIRQSMRSETSSCPSLNNQSRPTAPSYVSGPAFNQSLHCVRPHLLQALSDWRSSRSFHHERSSLASDCPAMETTD